MSKAGISTLKPASALKPILKLAGLAATSRTKTPTGLFAIKSGAFCVRFTEDKCQKRPQIWSQISIGTGYGDDDSLAKVALAWMVGQAQIAGVAMNGQNINTPTGNPVIHDQSNNIRFGNPQTAPATITVQGFTGGLAGNVTYNREDRVVNGAVSGTTQRTMGFGAAQAGGNRSLTNADTHRFITYNPRPANINQDTRITNDIAAIKQNGNQTGTVDMQAYVSWLRNHGYALAGTGQF